MYTLPLKNWIHRVHMPSRDTLALRMSHIVHDERFWPIMVAIALMATFIAIAIWAGMTGGSAGEEVPTRPFRPYGF